MDSSITCPNCGHENNEGDRFCSNCGARLTPISSPLEPEREADESSGSEASLESDTSDTVRARPTIPPPVTPSFARPTNDWETQRNREPVDDDWKMSDLGPPPARRRRTWLWIIIAILAALVLACCAFLFFISATDTGTQWFNDLATEVSEQATEAAR